MWLFGDDVKGVESTVVVGTVIVVLQENTVLCTLQWTWSLGRGSPVQRAVCCRYGSVCVYGTRFTVTG